MPKIPCYAARSLLATLFLVCVYRAFTQSITHDEALTWELYISQPASEIFRHFDANHHFLNTLLMRLSAEIFGVTVWSLRLPALGGAALYFAAIYRLAKMAFGEGWTFLLAVAVLSLNPFVLDFLVAARGYGLALALWMWALTLVLEAERLSPRRAALAGAAAALAVTANLIFLLPAAALAGITLYRLAKLGPAATPKKKRAQAEPPKLWIWFTAPIGAIALVYLLLAPVENAHIADFYTGAMSIGDSLRSMATVSLAHSGPLRYTRWNVLWCDVVAFAIAPLVLAVGLWVGVRTKNWLLILAAGSAVLPALMLVLIHMVLGRPYPTDRTGIYFLPLVVLALVALGYAGQDRHGGIKSASAAAYVLAAVFVVQFLTEFNTRKFLVWEYDADTHAIADSIDAHRDRSAALVHVGATWELSDALIFYGYLNNWTWMEVSTGDPAADADFYATVSWKREVISAHNLKEIYQGPISGSVLAIPGK